MQAIRWIGGAAVVLFAAAAPLHAHHSLTTFYDREKPVTLHGPITKVEWNNPHAFLTLDAQVDGTVVVWRVEIAAPRVLQKQQVTREMFAIGTVVTITGAPAKNGSRQAAGNEITLPDGSTRLLIEQRNLSHVTPTPWTATSMPLIYTAAPPVVALVIGLGIWFWRRPKKRAARAQ